MSKRKKRLIWDTKGKKESRTHQDYNSDDDKRSSFALAIKDNFYLLCRRGKRRWRGSFPFSVVYRFFVVFHWSLSWDFSLFFIAFAITAFSAGGLSCLSVFFSLSVPSPFALKDKLIFFVFHQLLSALLVFCLPFSFLIQSQVLFFASQILSWSWSGEAAAARGLSRRAELPSLPLSSFLSFSSFVFFSHLFDFSFWSFAMAVVCLYRLLQRVDRGNGILSLSFLSAMCFASFCPYSFFSFWSFAMAVTCTVFFNSWAVWKSLLYRDIQQNLFWLCIIFTQWFVFFLQKKCFVCLSICLGSWGDWDRESAGCLGEPFVQQYAAERLLVRHYLHSLVNEWMSQETEAHVNVKGKRRVWTVSLLRWLVSRQNPLKRSTAIREVKSIEEIFWNSLEKSRFFLDPYPISECFPSVFWPLHCITEHPLESCFSHCVRSFIHIISANSCERSPFFSRANADVCHPSCSSLVPCLLCDLLSTSFLLSRCFLFFSEGIVHRDGKPDHLLLSALYIPSFLLPFVARCGFFSSGLPDFVACCFLLLCSFVVLRALFTAMWSPTTSSFHRMVIFASLISGYQDSNSVTVCLCMMIMTSRRPRPRQRIWRASMDEDEKERMRRTTMENGHLGLIGFGLSRFEPCDCMHAQDEAMKKDWKRE